MDNVFKPVDPIILQSKVKVFIDLFTKSTLAVKLKKTRVSGTFAGTGANSEKKLSIGIG